MEITNAQRDATYDHATPTQLDLYESPESGAVLWQLATNHNLTEGTTYTKFAVLAGDVVLGLIPQPQLQDELKVQLGISDDQANAITADLLDFLSPLSNRAVRTSTGSQTETNDANNAQQSTDSNTEPTYTSSQETLLREGKTPPATIPTPPSQSGWESNP